MGKPHGAQRYNPFLIGIIHANSELDQVFSSIVHLNVKSVGLEVSPMMLSKPKGFFSLLGQRLQAHGITVVPLIPDKFEKRLQIEETVIRKAGRSLINEGGRSISKSKYARLIGVGLTETMVKEGKTKQPEALVMGWSHSLTTRKDLEISKDRCLNPTGQQFSSTDKKSIVALRRFQRDRRKQSASAKKSSSRQK
jgi:hypothetical protein